MRRIGFLIAFFACLIVFGQITEDFTDGDFTDGSPLTWVASQTSGGDDFVVTSGEVQSNGPAATGDIYLSTDLGIDFTNNDVEWVFKVRYDGGAPSSSNFVRIFLMSDVSDISGSPAGYYIRMGESGSTDGIDLFKTSSGTAIINDAGDLVATTLDVNLRVTRLSTGEWTLEADNTGGSTFSTVGAVTDTDFTSGSFFGMRVNHSSTRNQDYFLDDVVVTVTPVPDTDPPTIQSITAISDTEVDVLFSETVDQTTSETASNYAIDQGISVTNASRDGSNDALVHLTVSTLTNGTTYNVTINNVEDANSNAIASDSQDSFEYLVFEEAVQFDVVINEFMAAPSGTAVLPNVEFVELYNRSAKFINLANWTLNDGVGSSSAFSATTLRPGEFVILTATGNGALLDSYGDVLEVAGFPSLNNGGDDIGISNSLATEIHGITYTSSTSGVTTELINPNGPDYSTQNYGLSTDPDGGTPGAQNSIFDDTPDTTPANITSVTVISATELDVVFSEFVEQTSAETIGNYSIDGGIIVNTATLDGSDNTLVHLTVSTLVSGDTRTLTVNGVEDYSGNASVDATGNFQYIEIEEAVEFDVVINEFLAAPSAESGIPNAEYVELYNRSGKYLNLQNWTLDGQTLGSYVFAPDSYVLIVEDNDFAEFGAFSEVLQITTLTLSNTGTDNIVLVDDNATTIHSISFTGSTSGVSSELINPNGPDYSSQNYGLSTDPDGGTPEAQNSIFDDTPDTTPADITSVTVVSSTELDVVFSEFIEQTSAETIGNYSIDGGITVNTATLDGSDNTLVHLTVSTMVSGDTRTLTVNGVEDYSGNASMDATEQFEYIATEIAVAGDVVINEFLPLPSTESVIPNAEFIELYNISSKFIDLSSWTLQDAASTSSGFSSTILRPGDYLILTETGNGSLFSGYGDVLEVASFVSLNNSGDRIVIRNAAADTISETSYTTATSGISWELINPNGPDYSTQNFDLSTDPDGGTPGAQNSIFDDTPDTTPADITSVSVISSTELDVVFSEFVEQTSAENTANYSIDGGITVNAATLDESDNTLVHLTVSTLVSGDTRTLTVNGVEDYSGNASVGATAQFEYIATEIAVAGDVVINEFLPLPSTESVIPNAEFIELYNISSKFIDLSSWTLQDAASTSSGFSSTILRPGDYLILTEAGNGNLFSGYGDVLEVASFVSLNNSGDRIVIRNAAADTISVTSYSTATSGISWELINPNGPDYSTQNFGLSTDPNGGTPGAQNSIFDDTPDTTPADITSVTVISEIELDMVFSEFVEQTSAENTANYSIDGGIIVNTATLDGSDNTLVHLTVSTLVSGDTRTLTVNGVEDYSGNPSVDATAQFEYIATEIAVAGEVVINEFLPLPSTESVIPNAEFIELFNTSSKNIDLVGWTLQDAVSTSSPFSSQILRPGEYIILAESGNESLFSGYGDVLEVGNIISLNNSGDRIVIRNAATDTIAEISYTSATAGISWEMINPNGPDYSINNFGLSVDPDGGTPGTQNSIFDDTPDTTPPSIISVSVISNTQLDVNFNELLDETSAETSGNYTIDGGINVLSAIMDENDDRLVHLTLSPLTSAVAQTLTVNGVEDLSGNAIVNGTAQFEYIETEIAVAGDVVINEFLSLPNDSGGLPNVEYVELYNKSTKYLDLAGWRILDATSASSAFNSAILRPGEYLILTESGNESLFETYGDVLGVGSFVSLNNSGDDIVIQNSLEETMAEISYTSSQSGISLELVNPNDPCISILSYQPSIDASGGTPGTQNSVFNDTPDTIAPTITSFGFSNSLTINFSEVMDTESLINGSYVIIDQMINEVLIDSEFPTSVELTFVELLTPGIVYELTVSNVSDCAGNLISPTTLSFSIGQKPGFNDVIITEIMFDADPAIGLPEREFIEIYNTTGTVISTEGMQLSDATSTVDIPVFNLDPNAYYILTSTAGAAEFSEAIGVSGFPSLNNSGEQLILTVEDELVFSVTYDAGWHDQDKSDGGYSLEMIDVINPCIEDNNWGSSINSNGGTPGAANSLVSSVVDNFGPEVINVTAISADTIRIRFNEKLTHLVESEVSVGLSPSVSIDSYYFDISRPETLFVVLNEDLQESIQYALTIESVFDCSGNEIQQSDFIFALPALADIGDIKLSEVLFNPRSNGVDFVEIYNDSDQFLSLKNWKLARITEDGIDDQRIIAAEELVIDPNTYLVFTTDANVLLNNYPKGQFDRFIEVASLPTYANDTGNVVLLNDLEVVQEQFFYDEEYHYDLLESVDGVSLERVSFSSPANNGNNWRSASSTEGFATPGYANSQAITLATPAGQVSVDPKVFIPGNAGSGRDFTTINYQFDNAGQFANVNIYDQTGRLVKNLAQGELLSTTGFLRWDGVTDRGGMARMGYYVVVFEIYDSAGNTNTIKQTVVVGRDF